MLAKEFKFTVKRFGTIGLGCQNRDLIGKGMAGGGDDVTVTDGDGLSELKEWLFEEVADDRDIVVDEMQEQFATLLEQQARDAIRLYVHFSQSIIGRHSATIL